MNTPLDRLYSQVCATTWQLRCATWSIQAAGIKEYEANWLKNAKTVMRGPGGRFASSTANAMSSGEIQNLAGRISSLANMLPDDVKRAATEEVIERSENLAKSVEVMADIARKEIGKDAAEFLDQVKAGLDKANMGWAATAGEAIAQGARNLYDKAVNPGEGMANAIVIGELMAALAISSGAVAASLTAASSGLLESALGGVLAEAVGAIAPTFLKRAGAVAGSVMVGEFLSDLSLEVGDWQIDQNLPDRKGIAAESRAITKEITPKIMAMKKPSKTVSLMTRMRPGDSSQRMDKVEVYSIRYQGKEYASPDKNDLIRTVSYYAPRIKRLPDSLTDSFKGVTMSGGTIPDPIRTMLPFLTRGIEHGPVAAYAAYKPLLKMFGPDPIVMLNDNPARAAAGISVLVHEMGHNKALSAYGSADPTHSMRTDYTNAIAKDGKNRIGTYANASPAEDYAESTRQYFQDPNYLKEISPARYRVMRKIYGDIKKSA